MKIDKRFGKNRKILTPEQDETIRKSYKSKTNAQKCVRMSRCNGVSRGRFNDYPCNGSRGQAVSKCMTSH